MYLTNFKEGPGRRPIWRGDKANWVTTVKNVMRDKVDLLRSFRVVSPPANERRLVLQASNKGSRAQLIGAIRAARSHIKATPALTPDEMARKAMVYRDA